MSKLFYKEKENSPLNFYDSLKSFQDLQLLIKTGETESQYLECKSPSAPYLSKEIKNKLSQNLSAFANSGGGVIIWGIRTDKWKDLDRLTQIEPIPSVEDFKKALDVNVPILTMPAVQFKNKIIKEKSKDTKGIIITYVFQTAGDPVQANDGNFYLRIKDTPQLMPYETIKRMFLGTYSPDLSMVFDRRLIKIIEQNKWKIPIILSNKSNYPAKNTIVTVSINNPNACERIDSKGFLDQSDINPGRKIYITQVLREPIYKGLRSFIGEIIVTMKRLKALKRLLDITVKIYSEGMRARYQRIKIYLFKKRFKIKEINSDYLY